MGLAGTWCSSIFPRDAKVMMWTCKTGHELIKLHILPTGQTLTPENYFNQMLEKEVKLLTSRCHLTYSLIERTFFSSKKEVSYRSGWSSGSHFKGNSHMVLVSKEFATLELRMAGQWNLLISIAWRTSGVSLMRQCTKIQLVPKTMKELKRQPINALHRKMWLLTC